MLANILFIAGTLTLSLNFVRFGGLAISDWLYFGALALAILSTVLKDKEHRFVWTRNRLLPFTLLILIGALLSLYNAHSLDLAVFEIVQQIYTLTLFVSLAWLMVLRGHLETVVTAFILSGVFTAGIAIWDSSTGDRLGPMFSNTLDSVLWFRYAGTLGHPNKFGYFLVLTSLLALARLAEPDLVFWRRLVWLVFFIIQVFGIYLSGSVTAYVGLLVGVVAFIWAAKPLHNFLLRAGCVLSLPTAIVVVAIVFLVPRSSVSIGEDFIVEQSLDRVQTITAQSRWVVYEQALTQISRSPLIGASFDQLSTSGIAEYLRPTDTTVHNVLLQIWYAGGLLAFLGWAAIYIYLLRLVVLHFRKTQNNMQSLIKIGLAATVLAILVMDQFQDAVYQREKWLVLGLLLGLASDPKPPSLT